VNICFITKYPPIQGGVSTHCYWAARGLARQGHQVFVVTNANEVEPTFRLHLSAADLAPEGQYAPVFPEAGRVDVRSTEPPDRSKLYYVPMGNPTVTRLATIATTQIREHGCDVVFSYYLEPYGLAAYLASKWTSVPYVFKHAGSDLNRLMALEELRTAYVHVLLGANRVISRGPSRDQVLAYGVPEERVSSDVAFRIPTARFNPDATAVDLASLIEAFGADPVDATLPTLGIYGKLGEYKGSFDLLRAMAVAFRTGFRFNLVALAHGWQEARAWSLVEDLGLRDHVRILPFLPPWRIPGFIRACTAVAFLERDFPIAAHTPTIPSEVIACGTCLVVSAEVARKQLLRAHIRDGANVVVVADPKRHEELAGQLRYALADARHADAIGRQGLADLGTGGHHDEDYLDRLDALLTEVAAETPVPDEPARPADPSRPRMDVLQVTERYYPYTSVLLGVDLERRLRESVGGSALGRGIDTPTRLGQEVGRLLLSVLGAHAPATPAHDVCRYEYEQYRWTGERAPGPPADARFVQLLADGQARRVTVNESAEVVQFSHDVEAILDAIDCQAPAADQPATPVKVLFHTGSLPLRVNDATADLVDLIMRAPLGPDDLIEAIQRRHGCDDDRERARVREQCLAVLEGLWWEGVVRLEAVAGSAAERR
jgi:glycosyltransferase involved in cell wall biosynthesis